ncbi:hypothetical protein PF008_g33459 [Phytophthora fragariae]|uniref:Uncharacterized protein n=1 Tax=Phytophthora fragariae TaxID=53985 RepID=A0A6A3DFD3_9STRA|nr:hypothetical protein PF009_g29252 [Phytophthora fragariae]KAE9259068.1 hypothetical protein PF008_g33459 [Phytophthora fragariae]
MFGLAVANTAFDCTNSCLAFLAALSFANASARCSDVAVGHSSSQCEPRHTKHPSRGGARTFFTPAG